MALNIFLLDMIASGLEIYGCVPPGKHVTLQYVNNRLTEIERAAKKANSRVNAGDDTVIVAPEGFFGVALCSFFSRWSHVKKRLRAISKDYPEFLFVAGTAKRTRGSTVRSCCRVVYNGSKLRNVYKVSAAGASDICPGKTHWDAKLKNPAPGGSTGYRRSKTGCFNWAGMACGGEICNDARNKVLKNERYPNNDLDLILWVTRALYIDIAGVGTNTVQSVNFPLANGGFLVQCGSGDTGQDSYPAVGARGNFAANPATGDNRLGIYQKAGGGFNRIDPTGWSNLHHPAVNRFTNKVVFWLNL